MQKTIWERMSETFGALNEVDTVSVGEIRRRLLARFPQTRMGSIIPSDHCYNIIYLGIPFNQIPKMFLFVEKGKYRIMGENYPYEGDIFWKGERVGNWKGSPPVAEFQGVKSAKFKL